MTGTTELLVTHETAYSYATRVELAHHVAYLHPAATTWQSVSSHALTIDPSPSHQSEGVDGYGNVRTLFSLYAPHEALRVRAESRVRVTARFDDLDPEASPAWETVRDTLRYVAGAPFVPECEHVYPSPYVPIHVELREYALDVFNPGQSLASAAIELMQRIHADFKYEAEATQISTPVLEAFHQRHGVCQDFAHVMIGCLRAMGLSARYVSGYLLTSPPEGKERLLGADASHAWVSVHCPILGWIDLDPTNNLLPGSSHVTLATGRDYGDVAPLRGIIRGGGEHDLSVAVSVVPLD